MAKVIMIQGTMSNAGKSLIAAGLCRIFKQDGYRVAPFKSQNMALNSFATKEGLEMGRAQVVQAEAAGIEPMVCMNPILLKPTDDEGSQVIVNGRSIGNMKARDYFAFKTELIPTVKEAFHKLEEVADIIVIEGAGSPAEINLKENDIVNMGLAEMVDAPVLLVGDIDRGGVFAQLLGTVMLLEDSERERVKGLIINKFRGDASLLDSGIEMLEEKGGIPVAGVVPYMDIKVEDEDSLSERLTGKRAGSRRSGTDNDAVDIAVMRLPKISNFSDMDVFEQFPDVCVRYVGRAEELGSPDMVIIPGSKSTIADLRWLRDSGLEDEIRRCNDEGIPVFGICGGYQMLGTEVSDPEGVEGGGSIEGIGLLPVTTVLAGNKKTEQFDGSFGEVSGIFAGLSGVDIEGYEIHMGRTLPIDGAKERPGFTSSDTGICRGDVYGSYVHGIFDRGEIAEIIVRALAEKKGIVMEDVTISDHRDFKENEYNRLAEILRRSLDMDKIYAMLREAAF
ncbi:MAG: cobyric acid synthase [Clostridiales bacterium]|nr:cobyric acid synthase [Clostridiales bacterium]